MRSHTIQLHSHSARIKNVFANVAANLSLLGTDVRVEVTLDGSSFWHRDGILHRDDGPAEVLADGTKRWYKNGQVHRDGGPAIEGSDGLKSWWQNGKLHRVDGPAIEKPNGSKYWYVQGKEIASPETSNNLS